MPQYSYGTHVEMLDPEQRVALLSPLLRAMNQAQRLDASAVISGDGFVIASELGPDIEPNRFAAMGASLLALADRAAREVERGALRQVLVEGEHGTMLLVRAGTDAVLAVAAPANVNLGMIFLETRRTAAKIESLLG
ncbi:roadblock/LC7 domain-containing protein [Derxia gummosa]|uniref:Roadblock/LC7 domain-containing protein n=1 Tax=Derxia gummosa DSM 723 TaxID=1121388 RepID=A0A9U5GRY4_9BURK|nr:roadblock/LC7 domain-containing protein [Derxia gummosa]